MTTLTRRSLAFAVIAALALVASACSDSDDPEPATTDTTATTATSSTVPDTTGNGDDGHDHTPVSNTTGCNPAEFSVNDLDLDDEEALTLLGSQVGSTVSLSQAGVNAGQGGSAAGCKPVCVLEFPTNPNNIGAGSLSSYKLYVDHDVEPHELPAITREQFEQINEIGRQSESGEGIDQAQAATLLLGLARRPLPTTSPTVGGDDDNTVPNTNLLGKKMLFKSSHEVFFLGIFGNEDWRPPFVGSGSIGFLLQLLGGIEGIRITEDQQNCEAYGSSGEALDQFTDGPVVSATGPTHLCNAAEVYVSGLYRRQIPSTTDRIPGSNAGCVAQCVLQFPDDENQIGVSSFSEYRLYRDPLLNASEELVTITEEENAQILALADADASVAAPLLLGLRSRLAGQKMLFKTPQEVYFFLQDDDDRRILAHGDVSFMLEALSGIKQIRVQTEDYNPIDATCEAYNSAGELQAGFFAGTPEDYGSTIS